MAKGYDDDTDIGGRRSDFPETSVSALHALRNGEPAARARAFSALVDAYWKPVYKCVRLRFRKDNEEAKDLTQAFFTDALERGTFGAYEPGRGRFRVFIRSCLRNFVLNTELAKRRVKRGGGREALALDFDQAERELSSSQASWEDPLEVAFDRELARHLQSLAVEDLRRHLRAEGKDVYFELFERYELDASRDPKLTYAMLAAQFGLKTTDVTNYLGHARRKLRQLVLARLRQITATEEEYRSEAQALLGIPPDTLG